MPYQFLMVAHPDPMIAKRSRERKARKATRSRDIPEHWPKRVSVV
jgi:hypothetical protein